MKTFRCQCCRRIFPLSKRNPNQHYCSQPECQRARKRAWQRKKRLTDPDYKQNQSDAQKRWRENHPGYWRTYRKSRRESSAPSDPADAKMDESPTVFPVISGEYFLAPALASVLKKDAMRVILLPISHSYNSPTDDLIGKLAGFAYDWLHKKNGPQSQSWCRR